MGFITWIILLALPGLASSQNEDCAKSHDILSYLETVDSHSSDEIHIKGSYRIRNWLYLEKENKLETDGLFVLSWTNKSLSFSHLNPCHKSVKISSEMFRHWKQPHIFFSESSEMMDTSLHYRVHVHENGTVSLSKRIIQMIPCTFDSRNLPFGNTTCTMTWRYRNLEHVDNVIFDPSDLEDVMEITKKGSINFEEVQYGLTSDQESKLIYHFSQNPQDMILNFLLPSFMFLIPPWLTLLLGPMAITRCSVLMTSLLLLAIHFSTNVPQTLGNGGVTSITIWKLFAYGFIIAIVIELILITLFASLGRSKTCCFAKKRSAKYEMEPLYEELNDLRKRKTRKTRNCCRKTALFFDIASFIFFGIILVAFCYGFYAHRGDVVKMINDFELESLHIL
ncbi:hypothetical protein GCK72_022189 [Caenorhabditis remanei]|uniref:Neurotransmitter-gated ion-channel ligand-binding domain-containing protein n=1 Tax=Caenorhabditis remanei TaxID=31234 RepID=A0A6A5FT53_CAERE|nr:hypothetical protein GCK72_022189 [Caenorhabditis remanei]KAF1745742.1 hypothetical protein GCK72_022189 [Caenorhabditis remanei]